MSDAITVEALDKCIEFRNVDALQDHVNEILENRGGIFSPIELAAIRTLNAHRNGASSDEVARIARKTHIHSPGKPERGPTPLDDRIAQAAEKRAEAEEAEREALEHRESVRAAAEAEYSEAKSEASGSASSGHAVRSLRGRLESRVRDAEVDYLSTREAALRARARHNALLVARDRWHAAASAEYHNN